ncbi:hypothetical protein Golob_027609, partial [Gossypium lobatum]|nr:hypothetical protein [Gossypium lobatum]
MRKLRKQYLIRLKVKSLESSLRSSDDHGSILGLDDDDNIDACRRRSRFPAYNPNSASLHFCTGMMFKDGNFVDELVMLWDYADELRLKNLGSTIKMIVNRVTSKPPPHFKRFYVYFEALKSGWKKGCIPILSLNDCFLKGLFMSEMLSTVGRNGNNQMYLVSWAIVEGECIHSWSWFLSFLTTDLGMENGFGYIIISDQQK